MVYDVLWYIGPIGLPSSEHALHQICIPLVSLKRLQQMLLKVAHDVLLTQLDLARRFKTKESLRLLALKSHNTQK